MEGMDWQGTDWWSCIRSKKNEWINCARELWQNRHSDSKNLLNWLWPEKEAAKPNYRNGAKVFVLFDETKQIVNKYIDQAYK